MIRRLVSFAALVVVVAGLPAGAQRPTEEKRPKLAVVVVVDQMRADYLTRYSSRFSGGLRRLMRDGAWYQRAAYPYLNTITCAGHSTISTGALPYRHGMILNGWFNRATGQIMECTLDQDVTNISYNGLPGAGGNSAKWLLAQTFAEYLRDHERGRTVALSLKPRSALTLVGHKADAVVWFDDRGGWATSTAFSDAPVPFLQKFITENPLPADYGKTWDRLLEPAAYQGPDDGAGERPITGWTRTFPHPLGVAGGKPDAGYYTRWQRSPFADEYLGRMAAAAVDALHLGSGPGIDFLGISFSTLDLVGHAYGPESHEVQDELLRLDHTIGRLLDHLDGAAGKDGYVLALTSDHGVGRVAEQVDGAGRASSRDIGAAIDAALSGVWQPDKYFAASAYTDIYLTAGTLDRLERDPKATTAVLTALRAVPGVAEAFRGDEIGRAELRTSSDPVKRAAALSYLEGRSGDLIIIPRENWILSANAATHGTLYDYDQRVPIIFFGAGVAPGLRGEATPADVAPTLAALVHAAFPATDGHALGEALAVRAAR
jgi:predicted AlkP superfamily pyrophosphatase or phosphodiesterase